MEALISGRAGVALLWEGDALFSLHLGMAPENAVKRREWEIPHLLGGANDLRRLDGADRARVASELEHEARCFDALHLALMTFDSDLPPDLREEAAVELEEVFAEGPGFTEFVENVLFSHPLPKDGDLSGALRAARGAEQALKLLTDFERHQDQINEVWTAWQSIPDQFFTLPDERQRALSVFVRSGGFHHLAHTLGRDAEGGLVLAGALAGPNFESLGGEVWAEWLRLLQQRIQDPQRRLEPLEIPTIGGRTAGRDPHHPQIRSLRAGPSIKRADRREKILKLAKGYYGTKSKAHRIAKLAVDKSLNYAYRDRRQRKRQMRALWIVRINAVARLHGLSYALLLKGLKAAGSTLDRKVLADLAVADPSAFGRLVESAKRALNEDESTSSAQA